MSGATQQRVSLRNVRTATAASIRNERVTRDRVDDLERWSGVVARVLGTMLDRDAYLNSGIWPRLRWLVMGDNALPVKRDAPEEDQVLG
jgi:hypothetical protein